ncbi:transposase, partial [Patescibacteria group bacterium]
MTAQNNNTSHFHIYNLGIEEIDIFRDSGDYEVFLDYLKEYLNPPPKPEQIKKSFSIKGKTYQGVPHQPKNYYKKTELAAYSLQQDHFHLVVRELKKGSIEKLVRSLCTRYVIYFNKKYQRHGSLFVGPYKSKEIKDEHKLLLLTLFLHRESLKTKDSINAHTSYEYYLGEKDAQFLDPKAILSHFNDPHNNYLTRFISYRNFVEHYKIQPDDQKMLDKIVIERKAEAQKTPSQPAQNGLKTKTTQKLSLQPDPEPTHQPKRLSSNPISGVPEFIFASVGVFIVLFVLGIRNINTTKALSQELSSPQSPSTSEVSGLKATGTADPTNTPAPTATPILSPTTPQTEKENKVVIDPQSTTKPQKTDSTESQN